MPLDKRKVNQLQSIVRDSGITGIESRLDSDVLEILVRAGYKEGTTATTHSYQIRMMCNQDSIPENVEFALRVFRYCRSHPERHRYGMSNKITKIALYKKCGIIEHAKEKKELPDMRWLTGPSMHTLQAEVLEEFYGIKVKKVSLVPFKAI